MQCQFCKQMLEDVNDLQLHQVASCPAIEQQNCSISFENETVEVVFKWLIDRVIKVPAVFLIGSNMVDNIELKKGVGCFKSGKVTVTTGKYSGQLVIDNDIVSINDFEITLLSEVVHLIVSRDSSREETSPSNLTERDGAVTIDKQDGALHNQQSSRRDLNDIENALSPLHQEMLDHQIKNDYDFGDIHASSKRFGNLLSEENVKGDNTTVNPSNLRDEPTLHQVEDLSPDFSRVSQLPRDSEADDSFYNSFATPPAFETIDPDSTPSTPRNNHSVYANVRDMLSDMSVKDGDEGITSEPSMQSYVSTELIKHELEDAMRDTGPRSSLTSGGSEEFNNLLGEKDGSHIHNESNDYHNTSVDYAGNPMSRYDQPLGSNKVTHWHNENDNIDNRLHGDYAGNSVDKNEGRQPKKKDKKTAKSENEKKEKMQKEVQRLTDLIENHKEVKLQLETKCESYDHEVERLKKKCAELEQTTQNVKDVNDEKDEIINNLKVKAESYESEMNRLNQEVVHLTELLEENKAGMLEEKTKCQSYEQEIQYLNEKCVELTQSKEVEKLTKLMKGYQENKSHMEAKCESYCTEARRLTKKCADLEKRVAELQQANDEHEKTRESPCNEDSNLDSKKETVIAELSEKVRYYESEKDNSKRELLIIKEMLEDHKTSKLQLETKCGKYELEIKRLNDKCQELEKQNETSPRHKGDKSKSYKTEIKRLDMELHKLSETLESYKENKVQLEAKCASSDNDVKRLQDKCAKLEHAKENQPVPSESDMIKDRIIGDLKVKAESYESEMNRLHQEVKRLTDLVEEYKSKCQSHEDEIESVKGKYQARGHKKTDDLIKTYRELEQKFKELQTSNQKLIDDYQGLEGAKNVYEEEVQAERERYEGMIKELMDEKSKLVHSSKHDHRYSDNTARMNINKLKSENKLLKEKLNLIRNESEFNDSTTSKENISPRLSGYKPPLLPSTKSYEHENIKAYSHQPRPSSQANRHEHTSSNDDYALPSRYNANKYSKSPESYDKTDFIPHITDTMPTYNSSHVDNIMKRYSSPTAIDISADSIRGRPRSTRPNSYHDHASYRDHNEVDHTRLFSSSSRSRSLDHLDSSGMEDTTLSYKPKHGSITTIPFCPTSVKDLSIAMKVSVNRANGRLSRGTVKWIGTLPRHSGDYVGVELESEVGNHDGNLSGIQYFRCKGKRGIFVKFPKVIMAWK